MFLTGWLVVFIEKWSIIANYAWIFNQKVNPKILTFRRDNKTPP